jgi:hypothetical protein
MNWPAWRMAKRTRILGAAGTAPPTPPVDIGKLVIRMSEAALLAAPFFADPALVFIMGALMVFGGICVIANHQIWRGVSAIMISFFGWFLGLRGLALLLAPQVNEHLTEAS